MRIAILSLSVLAALLSPASGISAEPTNRVGQHLEITTKPKGTAWQRSSSTYLGTVVEADADKIVLENVSHLQRVEHRTPVLSDIPYFKRLLTNVGVGRKHLGTQRVTITQADIDSEYALPEAEFQQQTAIYKSGTNLRTRE